MWLILDAHYHYYKRLHESTEVQFNLDIWAKVKFDITKLHMDKEKVEDRLCEGCNLKLVESKSNLMFVLSMLQRINK